MIQIKKLAVTGWWPAIRGMRNPKNSWEKSDSKSKYVDEIDEKDIPVEAMDETYSEYYVIGPNDQNLMMTLRKSGSDHRKFMRMITVYADITAPLYWWKEFDTYKIGTVADSCSTMHKLTAKEFELDDFSHDHLMPTAKKSLEATIDILNDYRAQYQADTSPEVKKRYWWQMIQLLPSSYNQRRTVMLNYEVLVNMYKSRKSHKLDEWRDFCQWIEGLPFSNLITLKRGD